MKQVFILLLIVFLNWSCNEEKREDFTPGYPYSLLSKVKLTDEGKKRALAIWDSIHPFLEIGDSTTSGFTYLIRMPDIDYKKVNGLLSFDVDTAYYVKPRNLSLTMFIYKPLPSPNSHIYVGNDIIICNGKVDEGREFTIYKDTVSLITDKALGSLFLRKGMRFDTDRGPTTTFDEKQINNIKLVRSAYQALAVLTEDVNNPDYTLLRKKVLPLKK